MNPSSTSMEDQFINERVKQLLLQSVTFKQNLKFSCVMALTVDDEPARAIVINENFGPLDRAKSWAQTTFPLFNNIFSNNQNNNTFANTSAVNQQEILETQQNNLESKTGTISPTVYSSTSKRKKIKPCRIPQSNGNKVEEYDQNSALDLSKPDMKSNIIYSPERPISTDNDSFSNSINQSNFLDSQEYQDIKSKQYQLNNSVSPFNHKQSTCPSDSMNNPNEDNKSLFPLMYPILKDTTPLTSTPKKRLTNGVSGHKRSGASKVFACNQCKEQFTSLTALCKHTFSMHRAFRCNYCGANFTQRSNLQRHSLKHVGFKPFICNVCNKAYYRKDHLVRHIEVTHSEVDPKSSITVKLTSSECLDYLEKMQSSGDHPMEESKHVNSKEVKADEVSSNYLNMPKLQMGEDPCNESEINLSSLRKDFSENEDNRLMIVEENGLSDHPHSSPRVVFQDGASLDSNSFVNSRSNLDNSIPNSPQEVAEGMQEVSIAQDKKDEAVKLF